MPPRQGRYQPAFVSPPALFSERYSKADHATSREYHVVVLGAGGVGKSCLTGEFVQPNEPWNRALEHAAATKRLDRTADLSLFIAQFVHNEWIESYDPTIEDSYRTQVSVDGRQVVLEILDTAGTEQFGMFLESSHIPQPCHTDPLIVAMRDLYMKTGQGFLLVFSISSASSLAELAGLRDEIIRIKDDDNVPIVICGNKADLEDQRAVPRTKGFSLSQRWGAPYYESSARTRKKTANVDEVFVDLCRQMLRRDDAGESQQQEEPEFDPYSISYYKKRRKQRREREKDPHRPKCVIL